jgi:hypothetical protein
MLVIIFLQKKRQMKTLNSFYNSIFLHIFSISLLSLCFSQNSQAQKLEYWTTENGNLIYEEFLVARDADYFTITLSVRYRGDENKKYQLVSQRKIKSPSPQDCQVLKISSDTVFVTAHAPADLVTYKIKRGLNLLYLRPVYHPVKQWIVKQTE